MLSKDSLSRTVYDELRRLARARMHRLRPGQTLQPTDLVHEVYLRMQERDDCVWHSRAHFFGIAARAMRDVLVDHARYKRARKRGGDCEHVQLIDDGDLPVTLIPGQQALGLDDLLTVNRVLERLQNELPVHADIVQLRFFAGLTMPQIAELRGVSVSTIERYWRFTRAWLRSRMGEVPRVLAAVT